MARQSKHIRFQVAHKAAQMMAEEGISDYAFAKRKAAKFFGLMSRTKDSVDGQLWSRLSKEEQEELLLSDLESENPKNLISHTIIQKKHNKWL